MEGRSEENIQKEACGEGESHREEKSDKVYRMLIRVPEGEKRECSRGNI